MIVGCEIVGEIMSSLDDGVVLSAGEPECATFFSKDSPFVRWLQK